MASETKQEGKIRDCSDYYEEYKACTSLSNKIQTYYAFGYYQKKEDCMHWKQMFNLCESCTKEHNHEARKTLLAMEKEKADEIIKKRATVWTYRDYPPPMWYFPGKLKAEYEAKETSS